MMFMKSETLQTKLNTFHKAFGHPTDANYERSSIDRIKHPVFNIFLLLVFTIESIKINN